MLLILNDLQCLDKAVPLAEREQFNFELLRVVFEVELLDYFLQVAWILVKGGILLVKLNELNQNALRNLHLSK